MSKFWHLAAQAGLFALNIAALSGSIPVPAPWGAVVPAAASLAQLILAAIHHSPAPAPTK
jgi:hypothetical protein